MKLFVLNIMMLASLSAMADLEHKDGMEARPSEAKLSASRACWQELEVLGCGDPADDMPHFRQCLNDSMSKLTPDCGSMMQRLFGPRK